MERRYTQVEEHMAKNAPALDVSTRLAYDRTRLAYDRTLMAWVRTGTSLITFGFTVYKFFQFEMQKAGVETAKHLIGPREFAFMMIIIGLAALLLSTVQHWQSLKTLRAEGAELPTSTALIVAGLVTVLGIVALVAVIFRH
jgi:putative membrane protein